jgi:hypothetical protein
VSVPHPTARCPEGHSRPAGRSAARRDNPPRRRCYPQHSRDEYKRRRPRLWADLSWYQMVSQAAGNMLTPGRAGSRRVCRCGHPYIEHRHYRSGSECSRCLDCPRYRPAPGRIRRIIDKLADRRGHRCTGNLASWVSFYGCGGPSRHYGKNHLNYLKYRELLSRRRSAGRPLGASPRSPCATAHPV